jgi:CubicO group peptidase (beta-lactamase class C family)
MPFDPARSVTSVAFAPLLLAILASAPARAQAPASTAATRPAWASALDSAITAEMTRTLTPGAQVAVVVDGRLAYSRGYGIADMETGRTVTERTLFRVGSVTKMVTAATLTQLAADGKLDLQAPISTYVPELAGKRVGAVTTHQLLTHSAGWLDNAVAYGRMGEGALGEVMREVNDTLFFTEPSRVISYSNPGYSMAGYVGEMAAKQRFGATVDQLVLRNMGMPRATFRPLEAMTQDFSQGHVGQPGNPGALVRPFTENTAQWAAGFLFASAGELARFSMAIMDGGMLEGRRVLAEEAVRRMTTGHQAIPGSTTSRYGYGLSIANTGGRRVWQHGGSINGFDAQVTMFPDQKLAVIVLDNRSGAPMQGLTDLVAGLAAGIAPTKPPVLPDEREATAAERAQLVGTYKQGNTTVRIFEDAGVLKLQQGVMAAPVRLVGDERIVIAPPQGAKVTLLLVRGADGRVEYLHQSLRALARQP